MTLKVGKLSSAKTHLPYNYYDLPFCRPDGVTSTAAVIIYLFGLIFYEFCMSTRYGTFQHQKKDGFDNKYDFFTLPLPFHISIVS